MNTTLWNMNIIFLGEKERTKHNGYELSISALSPSCSKEFNIIPLAAITESAHSSMLLAISLLEMHQTFAVLGAPLEIQLSGLSRADTDPSGICFSFICGDWHILIKIFENLPAAEKFFIITSAFLPVSLPIFNSCLCRFDCNFLSMEFDASSGVHSGSLNSVNKTVKNILTNYSLTLKLMVYTASIL